MPFELGLGYIRQLLIDLSIRTVLTKVAGRAADGLSFVEQMQDNLQIVRDSLALAQIAQKVVADRFRQEATFKVGQKVYISIKHLPLTHANTSDQQSWKLQALFDGPFVIVRPSKLPNTWYLDLPTGWNIK